MPTATRMSTERLAKTRAARLDNHDLASEVKRHASVMARHLSYAEFWQDTDPRASLGWSESADRQETFFHAEVDEARKRLANADGGGDLNGFLVLYGARNLVR